MTDAQISQEYLEAATALAAVAAKLSQDYLEAATVDAAPAARLTQNYLETLVPSRRMFIGWGVPA